MREIVAALLALVVAVPAPRSAGAERAPARARVVVLPLGPGVDTAPARAAAERAGFSPVVLALPAGDDDARLAAVERGLAEAQEAWLAQRYGDMDAILARLERDALAILARPEHAATLWQLEFQRGLMHLSRGRAGDAEEAARRFRLALELVPARRPERGTYPPAVIEAFALAAEEQGRRVARAVPLRVDPADAALVIDLVPVVEPGKPRLLRPGLHVVLAEAPGHVPWARVVEVSEARLDIALAPLAGVAPLDALAPFLRRGELRPEGPSTRRVLDALATGEGAVAVLLVGADGARVLGRGGLGPWQPDAATALAGLDQRGGLVASDAPRRRSAWRSPWLWTGVGAVVVGAVVLGVVLAGDDAPPDRTHIGF